MPVRASSDDDLYTPSRWGQIYHGLPDWEVLGAGSAGPGKSIVLLHDADSQIYIEHKRCEDRYHPYYHPWGMSTGWALHLRRTRPMLEESIARAHRCFPRMDTGARWNEQKTTWTFSSGYKYQFGHVKDPNDWTIYWGNQYTRLLWDELVQFEEEQYDQIGLRLRSSDPVLQHMLGSRSMSNPLVHRGGGESVVVKNPNWVRDRFIKPAREGKVRFRKLIRREDGTTEVRSFIYLPATLYDNPDKEFVRQYEVTLRDKKPHIVQAMLYGNWFVTAGSYYGSEWNDRIHTCQPFRIPPDWRRFRSMDWGFRKPGCVHWWALDHDDTLYCEREYTFMEKTDIEVAKTIRDIERSMGLWKHGRSILTGPADTQLWEERGESSKTKAQTMLEAGVMWLPADKKSRLHNCERLTRRLKAHEDGTKPAGIVFMTQCSRAIETIPAIQTDPDNPELPVDGGDDHWHDSAVYACAFASHGRAGIPAHDREDDDEDDEPFFSARTSRGRYGYGGA